MIEKNCEDIGKIEVSTIDIYDEVKILSATYTYSGNILISYKTKNDLEINDYYNVGTINDDGKRLKKIFSGIIPQKRKANGIRFIPYPNNKNILLGDYVMECYPNIDQCDKVKIIPIKYPYYANEGNDVFRRWSEIIISPDNNKICWTMLKYNNAVNFIGELKKKNDKYEIKKVRLISTLTDIEKDKNKRGYIKLL